MLITSLGEYIDLAFSEKNTNEGNFGARQFTFIQMKFLVFGIGPIEED